MSVLEEFKAFALKGNVVDLAVGVIIGAAFGKIVSSLVDDIIMPLIGIVAGNVDFSNLVFKVGESSVRYGKFLTNVIDFGIVAFSIFLTIKVLSKIGYHKAQREEETKKLAEAAKKVDEVKKS